MTKYQIYASWLSKGGWFKIGKPFDTESEAEKRIKHRQQIVLYNTMNYKIEKVR